MEPMQQKPFGRRGGFEAPPAASAEHQSEPEFNVHDYKDSKDPFIQDRLLRREEILAHSDRVADDERQLTRIEEEIRQRSKSPNQMN